MRRILTGICVLALAGVVSAQQPSKPAQVVVNNAPGGISIDVFMDAGKVQTVPVSAQGTTSFELDFLSLGKPQGQVYIESCKDGARIRVISDGTNVATDEGCTRKPVGVAFTFTCTKKITLNFREARGSFSGCGTLLTNKYTWTGVGATVTGLFVGLGGGEDTTSPFFASPPANNSVSFAPPEQAPSQLTPPTPPAQQPTQPTQPAVGNPGGTQVIVTCTVGSDPGAHNAVLRLCSQLSQISVSASNGGLTMSGAVIWVTVGGSYNTTTGAVDISRNGPLAGTAFTNVDFRFVGTIDANGNMSGTVTIGGNGLPGGQAITYQMTMRKS